MNLTVWLIFIVLFAIIEGFTLDLTSIWFSFGSLIAMISALFFDSYVVQSIFFIAGTTFFLLYLKPISKKMLFKENVKTNIDMIIGKTGIVTSDVTSDTGEVKVSGKFWSARSFDDKKTFTEGTRIEVLSIQGVKLIIKEI
ncbi:MAG: NfeD family protein [Clostridia bacterium]